jgi:hypothetical protein
MPYYPPIVGVYAPLASPAFTGTPTAPTASVGDSSTQISTTAFAATAISNAVAGVNPAVAVTAASAVKLPNSPTYNNGASGVGAFITTLTLNTALVVDGVTPTLGQRILVKNEGDSGGLGAAKNGVYVVSQLAAVGLAWILTRAVDFNASSDINDTGAIPVISGTANAVTQWVISSSVTTVGTDAITFAQFTYNPSNYLLFQAGA